MKKLPTPHQTLLAFSLLVVALYLTLAAMTGTLQASPLRPEAQALPQGFLARTQAVLGLLAVVSFPGLPARLLLPSRQDKDLFVLLLEGLGVTLLSAIAHLTLLKLLGVPVTPLALSIPGILELVVLTALRQVRGWSAPQPRSACIAPPARSSSACCTASCSARWGTGWGCPRWSAAIGRRT